jgi:hypothetical protein
MSGQEPMVEQGRHCVMAPSGSTLDHGTTHKTCCASTHMAVTAAPAGLLAGEPLLNGPAIPAIMAAQLHFVDEIATPPPRYS